MSSWTTTDSRRQVGDGDGGESHEDYDEGGRVGGAERFDEYDEYDDGGAQAASSRRRGPTSSSSRSKPTSTPKKAEPPKPKEPEVDLFDFGDDEPAASGPAPLMTAPPTTTSAIQPPAAAPLAADDDDFDDFQSAAPTPAAAAPAPTSTIPKPNYSSFSMAQSTGAPGSATQFAQPSPSLAHRRRTSATFSRLAHLLALLLSHLPLSNSNSSKALATNPPDQTTLHLCPSQTQPLPRLPRLGRVLHRPRLVRSQRRNPQEVTLSQVFLQGLV